MREKNCLILFADLDHLKEINDFFGHIKGDFSIRTLCRGFKEGQEQMDIKESAEMNSALSRWGN